VITQQDIDDVASLADPLTAQTPLDMVREFAIAMDHPLDERWKFNRELEDLRYRLVAEEFGEFSDESDAGNRPAAMLSELADIVYVVYGYAATFGWNLDVAVRRIHTANMSKLGSDGKPLYRPDGKVLKGPNYTKANLSDLVRTTNE
tara:strand:+ start:361 stop:801 length:441 start_codon:yes stop_codon:yes gene_type:complete